MSDNSDEAYEKTKRCLEEGVCKTMKDYVLLYLKTDKLLSVDVFKKFREQCLEYHEIVSCYTYSTPGLTWILGLKYTHVRGKYYIEETVNIYMKQNKNV